MILESLKEVFKYSMFLGIILGIIFIIYTNFSKKRKDKSIVYLNLFVLFLTLNNLQITLVDNHYIEVDFFIRKLLIPWYALILPSFYTFVTYYLKVEKKITSFILFSSLLFALEIMIRIGFIPYFYFDNDNYIVSRYAQIEEILNAVYTLFIFVRVVIIFLKQSKLYQFVLTFDNMKWLKQFLLIGFVILLLWVTAILFNLDKVVHPEISIYYPLRFSSTFLLYWIAYQGFFHYNLLAERIKLREAISNDQEVINEISKDETPISNDFIFIQNHILNHKKYLDPNFSVEMLATEIKMSARNVSQILQKHTGNNFIDYINLLRVEKAKKYLIDASYSDYTIVSIGLECGFYSKSTFYRAFSKFVNTTPTSYRENNQL
jgi:AraC-like DNA-binding protein